MATSEKIFTFRFFLRVPRKQNSKKKKQNNKKHFGMCTKLKIRSSRDPDVLPYEDSSRVLSLLEVTRAECLGVRVRPPPVALCSLSLSLLHSMNSWMKLDGGDVEVSEQLVCFSSRLVAVVGWNGRGCQVYAGHRSLMVSRCLSLCCPLLANPPCPDTAMFKETLRVLTVGGTRHHGALCEYSRVCRTSRTSGAADHLDPTSCRHVSFGSLSVWESHLWWSRRKHLQQTYRPGFTAQAVVW